jgi:hypothetical protein
MFAFGDGHTSNRSDQIAIIAHGGLGACDGAHNLFVMKEIRGPAQAKLGRATRRCTLNTARQWQVSHVHRGYSWFHLSPHSEVGENSTNCRARQKNGHKEHEYPRECAAKGTKSIG